MIFAANKHTPAQLTLSYAENKLDIFLIIIERLRHNEDVLNNAENPMVFMAVTLKTEQTT